jgi:hypothetical protein
MSSRVTGLLAGRGNAATLKLIVRKTMTAHQTFTTCTSTVLRVLRLFREHTLEELWKTSPSQNW